MKQDRTGNTRDAMLIVVVRPPTDTELVSHPFLTDTLLNPCCLQSGGHKCVK